jgi:hypothetical protein
VTPVRHALPGNVRRLIFFSVDIYAPTGNADVCAIEDV